MNISVYADTVVAGRIVKDSCSFQNEKFIWPEGYTAVRLFSSITGDYCSRGVYLESFCMLHGASC